MRISIRKAAVRVFAGDKESLENVTEAFLSLFPFDLKNEKVEVSRNAAEGLSGSRIVIIEARLAKQAHLKKFLGHLLNRLTKEQKELLISQKESRLDDELNFFIRLDKTRLIENREFFITDSGNCFHITLSIAAFPAKREPAMALIDKIFK